MKCTDPTAMAAAERFAEIAELLARAIQRLLAAECKAQQQRQNSQICLAVVGAIKAPCGSHALNPKSRKSTA